ncbi:MAG: class I tRNA ligase family protein [Phycisphaerae bacterium]
MANTPQDNKPGRYDPAAIEARWRDYWEERDTFRTLNPGEPGFDADKPKFYILDMFPYPSGAGLHVGHPVGYCATDIIARYKRMRGFNVLHPMGFDAFGLPAEQYAIEHNVHPAVTTRRNIDRYREQLKMFGFSYDWGREVATCDPQYYKFTQWVFLRMFDSWYDGRADKARPIDELVRAFETGELPPRTNPNAAECSGPGDTDGKIRTGPVEWHQVDERTKRLIIDSYRLAYLADVSVNWCPALGTVLANEEVTNEGRSDRGNHPVYRRPLRQWMLRITNYADRLLTDLDGLDWPEPIKIMQRNWIGKSTGAEAVFPLAHQWGIENGRWICREDGIDDSAPLSYETVPHAIRVYTTRSDTLFGATYMVLAPEHELVERITTDEHRAEVEAYVAAARNRSDLDRTADTKEKTGVFTGAYAINPVNGRPIPIWIADYVLMGYGTGAIMAVPAHDIRDFEFAKTFGLPLAAVVEPDDDWFHEQIMRGALDADYCARRGKPELVERIMQSATKAAGTLGGITAQDASAILDGDAGWVRQVALPVYEDDPGIFAEAFVGEGTNINSPGRGERAALLEDVCDLNDLPTPEAQAKITAWLEGKGLGRAAVNYKLRDWIFSRQKYWGEPFPVLHGEGGETIGLSDDELPVELPDMEDFKPTPAAEDAATLPEPPLGRAKEWLSVERDGRRYRRDMNTMPQWAGSCWYYLRFIDPHNMEQFCGKEAERYWTPVDLYVGGAEHAVLHLLYARFWHKVLYDLGFASTREPFQKLFNQGMIQGFAYRDSRGVTVGPDVVEERGEDQFILKKTGQPVTRIIAKMSKALKNVVSPDEIIAESGADTFRLYEMYMGPLEASKPWNTRDVPGLFKLCQRVWRLVVDENTGELTKALTDDKPDTGALRALHKLIKRVTEDLERLKLNTAIAAIFDFVNFMTPRDRRSRTVIEPFVLVVSPFAPHLGEELWHRLGHDKTLAYEPWPQYDEKLARDEEVEIGVQINGKLKARVMVATDADEESIREAALAEKRIVEAIAGKTIRKVIVVKGRLVNIVANQRSELQSRLTRKDRQEES